jgi:hypothetical protein
MVQAEGRESDGLKAESGKEEPGSSSSPAGLRDEQGIIVAVIELQHLQVLGGVGHLDVGCGMSIAGAAAFQIGITLSVGPRLS